MNALCFASGESKFRAPCRGATRGIGLGPAHDWSSHAADAFGLMCVAYEAPRATARMVRPRRREVYGGPNGWMA